MVASSGEQGNYGDNVNSVKSGLSVKTNLPAIAYIAIIVVFLLLTVTATAGTYGFILRKGKLRARAASNHEVFARL